MAARWASAELIAPLDAIAFLSIARPPRRDANEGDLHRAVKWFPFVGVCFGLGVALLDLSVRNWLPTSVASVLELGTLALASGGLHLDGLADAADGLFPLLSRERRLEVMRAPAIGAYGAAALVLVLLMEYAALASLTGAGRTLALVLGPISGRLGMSLLLVAFPYARPAGLGQAFRRHLGAVDLLFAIGIAGVCAVAVFGPAGSALVAVGLVPALLVGASATRVLGGCTGDIYGAAGELACATVFAVASVWAR